MKEQHNTEARIGAQAKLDADKVREIRKRHKEGESTMALAKAFDVHYHTVGRIISGKTWSHVE